MSIFRIVTRGSKDYIASINGAITIVDAMIALQEKIKDGSCDKYLTGVWKKFVGWSFDRKAVWQFFPEGIIIFYGGIEMYGIEFSGSKEEIVYTIEMDIQASANNEAERS